MSENQMSVDAEPENPSRSGDTESSDMDRHIRRDFGAPTQDWRLKNFLLEIANELTKEDLDKLKFIFSGDGGLGKAVLEKVTETHHLFELLLTRKWLSRDNLLRLQRALMSLPRMDIVEKAIEYAQTIGNVIHFYPSSDEPENGFRRVRFHIGGYDSQNCSRDQIQFIKMQLAELLFVSPEFIIIQGLEPATSLILTLDIPERYVEILIRQLKRGSCHSRVKEIGADIVEIPDLEKLFHISVLEKELPSKELAEQQKKLRNIYEQFEITKEQLETSELTRLELQDRIHKLEKEMFEKEALLKSKLLTLSDEKDRPELATEAFKDFEKQVQRPELDSYDKKLLLSLIDANTKFVASAVSEGYQLMEDKMKILIKELEAQILPLKFELIKLRTFSSQEAIEQIIRESFRRLHESVSGQGSITIEVNDKFLEILRKVSQALRASERVKIEKLYEWSKNDELKQAMDNDPKIFLVCILRKEIDKTQTLVDPEKFIPDVLEKVGRVDLKKKFVKLVTSMKATDAQKTAEPTQDRGEKARARSLERNVEPGVRLKEDLVQTMADQISKMHEIIVTAHEQIQRPPYVGNTKRLFCEKEDSPFVF